MVAHVLLTGVYQRLVIPTLQLADCQRLGDKTSTTLAGEHLVVYRRYIPFGPSFSQEISEQLLMSG
jgi:hypothetical protein